MRNKPLSSDDISKNHRDDEASAPKYYMHGHRYAIGERGVVEHGDEKVEDHLRTIYSELDSSWSQSRPMVRPYYMLPQSEQRDEYELGEGDERPGLWIV